VIFIVGIIYLIKLESSKYSIAVHGNRHFKKSYFLAIFSR